MSAAVDDLTLIYRDRGSETDGIRDYTNQLQEALRDRLGAAKVADWLNVGPGFSRAASARGGWLVQYNPFAYARWGFAPWLPAELVARRLRRPRPRLGVMVHEPFVPLRGLRWTTMGLWQRVQLWAVIQSCDVVFVSTEAWAARLARWRPARPVHHLPVGSNLPDMRGARATVRAEMAVGDDELVVAALASPHVSYMRDVLVAAVAALPAGPRRPIVLLLGGDAPELPGLREIADVRRSGRLPAETLAARIAAADVFVSPLRDGVSTRRGTVMAALQHGVAVVGTDGPSTDGSLRDPSALCLAPVTQPGQLGERLVELAADPARRRAIGEAGRRLYAERFDWPVIAGRILEELAPE